MLVGAEPPVHSTDDEGEHLPGHPHRNDRAQGQNRDADGIAHDIRRYRPWLPRALGPSHQLS